jgi:hypothetical protein
MQKILFDARELEHPQPLEKGVKHLLEMDEDSYLYMIHRKNPLPLLKMAEERVRKRESEEIPEGQRASLLKSWSGF